MGSQSAAEPKRCLTGGLCLSCCCMMVSFLSNYVLVRLMVAWLSFKRTMAARVEQTTCTSDSDMVNVQKPVFVISTFVWSSIQQLPSLNRPPNVSSHICIHATNYLRLANLQWRLHSNPKKEIATPSYLSLAFTLLRATLQVPVHFNAYQFSHYLSGFVCFSLLLVALFL